MSLAILHPSDRSIPSLDSLCHRLVNFKVDLETIIIPFEPKDGPWIGRIDIIC